MAEMSGGWVLISGTWTIPADDSWISNNGDPVFHSSFSPASLFNYGQIHGYGVGDGAKGVSMGTFDRLENFGRIAATVSDPETAPHSTLPLSPDRVDNERRGPDNAVAVEVGSAGVVINNGEFIAQADTHPSFGFISPMMDLVNAGRISAISDEVAGVGVSAWSGPGRMINTGEIYAEGKVGAVGFAASSYAPEVENHGDITAVADGEGAASIGLSVYYAAQDSRLVNSGSITGDFAIVSSFTMGYNSTVLDNRGEISGAILLDTAYYMNVLQPIYGSDLTYLEVASNLETYLPDMRNSSLEPELAQPDLIRNSGAISGIVALGGGGDIYLGSGQLDGGVYGEAGSDVLIGGATADSLFGGDGADLIYGGGAADTLSGGASNDVFVYRSILDSSAAAPDRITDFQTSQDRIDLTQLGATSVELATENEVTTLTATTAAGLLVIEIEGGLSLADVVTSGGPLYADDFGGAAIFGLEAGSHLLGGAGDDVLVGQSGNDTLVGGEGVDTSFGGLGDDVYYVYDAHDRIWEFENEGTDTLISLGGFYGSFIPENVEIVDLRVGNHTFGNDLDNIIYANDGSNTLTGEGGDDEIYGRLGHDRIEGGGGDDYLDGGGGIDRIFGGDGNDFLIGGPDGDRLEGGDGVDTASYFFATSHVVAQLMLPELNYGEAKDDFYVSIENLDGSAFSDLLAGDNGANVIFGYTGDDQLLGLAGDDLLSGWYGDDQLEGGAGADILSGGEGFDLARHDYAAAGVTAHLAYSWVNTGDAAGDYYHSIEGLVGSRFGDFLAGEAGDNIIYGVGGNDRLYGLDGADQLFGGDGVDFLEGGAGADVIDGGAGYDFARHDNATGGVTAHLLYAFVNEGDAAGDTYAGIEGLVGSYYGDFLAGDGGSNEIYGLGGADRIYGLDGGDLLYGDEGDDFLEGGAGGDLIDGGAGFDMARHDNATAGVQAHLQYAFVNLGDAAGDAYVSIEGLAGSTFADFLAGNEVDNRIEGLAGNDSLYGLTGHDQLFGGDGADFLEGGAGNDLLDGGAGFDFARHDNATSGVTANLASSWVNAGDAAGDAYVSIEGLVGSYYADTLVGDGASNEIYGLSGDDAIYGLGGADQLFGDGGADTFHFFAGDSVTGAEDVLRDFQSGTDRIDLTALRTGASDTVAIIDQGGGVFRINHDQGGDGSIETSILTVGAVTLGDIILTTPPPSPAMFGEPERADEDDLDMGTAAGTMMFGAAEAFGFGDEEAGTVSYSAPWTLSSVDQLAA